MPDAGIMITAGLVLQKGAGREKTFREDAVLEVVHGLCLKRIRKMLP